MHNEYHSSIRKDDDGQSPPSSLLSVMKKESKNRANFRCFSGLSLKSPAASNILKQ